ncbi:hypothetical protein EV363DRAFT_1394548 [Boletus edulis]|uniref:Uncharacterized protein n=1 Tax=Boletus edulis BED1 TaxID=1328754 RepID=A0AAD4BC20_BOLED|nr:hypothetical protein EV363DRAFT_1463395 [Boletus edulis]KAF8121246.1 hypothetical protein EV363DRAFT_1302283 [Boletus edulis]KAF8136959.1 hypothetical protein EV363DRAFT_1394548 [Boletus edulis]KAF8416631.1 hypothetical protein L210DRAFT_3511702 [Boletus edulis BED1]KAF8423159.1 hypothetical protein L210DRAFT_3653939 [Boletus edulis BED1]
MDCDTVTTKSNSPAPDLSSEQSDRSTTGQLVTAPLTRVTTSTVPATPNTAPLPSFPFPRPKSELSMLSGPNTRQDHARDGVASGMRGTPFNGVNHGVRRHILPGSVSRVGSGTPFRNGYLALTPGVPSAHHNFDGPRKRPADVIECFDDDEDDGDDGRLEFEQKEALLFLDMARARGNVRKLEQKLAQAKWDEINITGKLYKLQAEEAERRSDAADVRVGVIRNSIRMTGGTLCDTSVQKRRRISPEDSIQIEADLSSGSLEV